MKPSGLDGHESTCKIGTCVFDKFHPIFFFKASIISLKM